MFILVWEQGGEGACGLTIRNLLLLFRWVRIDCRLRGIQYGGELFEYGLHIVGQVRQDDENRHIYGRAGESGIVLRLRRGCFGLVVQWIAAARIPAQVFDTYPKKFCDLQ